MWERGGTAAAEGVKNEAAEAEEEEEEEEKAEAQRQRQSHKTKIEKTGVHHQVTHKQI